MAETLHKLNYTIENNFSNWFKYGSIWIGTRKPSHHPIGGLGTNKTLNFVGWI